MSLQSVLVKFLEGMLYYYGRTKDDMNDIQVKMIVDDIIEKYYYFRIEDVCLCFKKARQDSKYKNFYGRIDGSVIMSWFATYDKERDEVIQSIPDEKTAVYSGNEISREEYLDICLAKAAGGDMDAYKLLIMAEIAERAFMNLRGEYHKYKYNQKHKFDTKNGAE